MEDDDFMVQGLSSRLQARLDSSEYSQCKVVVSNLQTSVTSDDIIVSLFKLSSLLVQSITDITSALDRQT